MGKAWKLNKVVIFGASYKVVEEGSLKDSHGQDCDGLCDVHKRVISINKNQKRKDKEQTVCHEIGHAVFDRIGIDQMAIDDSIKECIVDSIATAITENFDLIPITSKLK